MEITTAVFEPESKYAKTTGLWQYDYGQILRLQGLDLPKAVEIHFSLSETGGESVTRIGTTRDGVTDVLIPDSMLENNDAISDYSIFAFVFLTDDKSGNTEYRIKLSVKARPRPEVPGSPEEPELFRETIKEVNQAADRSEEARDQAEAWAHGRDDYPDCEEDNAKYYAAKAADSASAAEKSSENADKTKVEVEKLAESIKQAGTDALKNIQDKELRSKQNITSHADDEINRINKNVGIAEENLQGTIRSAGTMQQDLKESISQAETMKTAVDQSAEDAGIEKQELDKTISKATDADSTLSKTINTASTSKIDLDKTIQDATELDNNLDEKITEGIALNKTLQDTSSKAVSDIQIEADTQLQRVQTAAEGIEADREQINANTEEIDSLREDLASGISRITSVEELKADKISLAKTDKKLDALWKLNQGVSYEFQNDDTASYQKTVPTGAKLASIQNIGGKTIVWNQLAGPVAAKTENGLTVTVDKETSKFTIDGTSTDNTFIGSTIAKKYVGHKVLFRLGTAIPGTKSYATIEIAKGDYLYMRGNDAIHGKIIEIAGTDKSYISWYIYACETGITFDCITYTPQIFDLTQMFGIGNEPSTVEEFEAMFPADYYPYNAGELMSTPVNEVRYLDTKSQETSYPIPQAILNLPGYGWSAGDVRNEVNWENKQYHKRVGKVDLGTLEYRYEPNTIRFIAKLVDVSIKGKNDKFNCISNVYTAVNGEIFDNNNETDLIIRVDEKVNQIYIRNLSYADTTTFKNAMSGVILYYELAEEQITDISNLIGDTLQEPIEVEAGGALTFKNSSGDNYRIPVSSTEEYLVSLAEVAK